MLSPYNMAAMTVEEVAAEHYFQDTMGLAMATTLSDAKRLLTKKVATPRSVHSLLINTPNLLGPRPLITY